MAKKKKEQPLEKITVQLDMTYDDMVRLIEDAGKMKEQDAAVSQPSALQAKLELLHARVSASPLKSYS